jgi:hypothetical protein
MKFLLLFLLLVPAAYGQTRTFEWTDELCSFKGTYNSRNLSERKLRNTVRLTRPGELSLSSVGATVWNFSEIAELDTARLDREYNAVKSELENLDIIDTPYWQGARAARLKEIEQVYRLARLTMRAYTKPDVLREYPAAAACKTKFAEPIIAGGDKLLAAWRVVNLDSQSKNSDPARLQRRFDEQINSPQKFEYALVETMAFGWWNCANAEIEYDERSSNGEYHREFRKLFTRVTEECDEP